MDYKEFSKRVKAKYPEYSEIDDRELAQRVINKYPEYSDVTFDEPAPTRPGYGAKNYVSDLARPTLEIGGAVGGGVAGAPLGPVGVAAGGALGYAGGKSAADLLDRYMGVKDPLQSFPDAARETASSLYEGAKMEAMGQGIGAVVPAAIRGGLGLVKSASRKMLPAIFKTTAGIPEKATEMVLENPELLKRSKISDEQLNEAASPIIDGLRKAKQSVGEKFGRIYNKITGMNGPIDDFVNDLPDYKPIFEKRITSNVVPESHPMVDQYGKQLPDYVPPPPGTPKTKPVGYTEPVDTIPYREAGPSLDDLRMAVRDAKDGSLFKRINPATRAPEPISNQEKLVALTQLKRNLQSEVGKNTNAISLTPIDTVQDAALKKMISEVDDIRSTLPRGKRLAILDDAWSEIRNIYAKVQRDFSEPGKARDTLMRLMRGESNWMTQGRNTVKLNAIKRAEELTGQDILKPAMEELAAALYQQPVGYGIKPALTTAPAAASAITSLLLGHPGVSVATMGAALSASPKVVGMGLRAGSSAARMGKNVGKFIARRGVGLGLAVGAKNVRREARKDRS